MKLFFVDIELKNISIDIVCIEDYILESLGN